MASSGRTPTARRQQFRHSEREQLPQIREQIREQIGSWGAGAGARERRSRAPGSSREWEREREREREQAPGAREQSSRTPEQLLSHARQVPRLPFRE